MIILDTNSIAAKSFFATHHNADRFSEKDFGRAFLNSFLRIISDLTDFGSELLLCLDSKSWRHEFYPDYKKNRDKIKEETFYLEYKDHFHDMIAEMSLIMPIRVVKKPRYEADDLLAYYVRKFPSSIMVSNDKDMKQLIDSPKVQMYNFVERSMVRLKDKKFFLHRLICLGDTGDNIPKIIPRNDEGKYYFKFGEKTIEKEYDENAESSLFIKSDFLVKVQKKLELSKEDFLELIETVSENYERNKILIDLSLSSVHKENFKTEFKVKYNFKDTTRFLFRYLGDAYTDQVDRVDMVMKHYFNG